MKIRIGKKIYRIVEKDYLKSSKHSVNLGGIWYNQNKIEVLNLECKAVNQNTLFHEISHGILFEMSKKHPLLFLYNNNEKFVQELALTLQTCFSIKRIKG